jgi:hypothetical protein
VIGHGLRMLERAVAFQVIGDAGGAQAMVADLCLIPACRARRWITR